MFIYYIYVYLFIICTFIYLLYVCLFIYYMCLFIFIIFHYFYNKLSSIKSYYLFIKYLLYNVI